MVEMGHSVSWCKKGGIFTKKGNTGVGAGEACAHAGCMFWGRERCDKTSVNNCQEKKKERKKNLTQREPSYQGQPQIPVQQGHKCIIISTTFQYAQFLLNSDICINLVT